MRDLVFQDFEEALAAYVLGPFLFRCSVCGQTHKSAGHGWAACAAKLMRDHALSSWASPDARHTVLAADALAAAAGDSAMTVMLARVGPAPVLLSLSPDEVKRTLRAALERWWREVARSVAELWSTAGIARAGDGWFCAEDDLGGSWLETKGKIPTSGHRPPAIAWTDGWNAVAVVGWKEGDLWRVAGKVGLARSARPAVEVLLRDGLNPHVVVEKLVGFLPGEVGRRVWA